MTDKEQAKKLAINHYKQVLTAGMINSGVLSVVQIFIAVQAANQGNTFLMLIAGLASFLGVRNAMHLNEFRKHVPKEIEDGKETEETKL